MLNGKLSLHELDDVEAVCANVIRRANLELSHHEREDCLAFLVATAWELSLVYERGDFPSRFGVYLSRTLAQRLHDWRRQRNGRTRWTFGDGRVYERPLPSLVSLDDRPDGSDHGLLDHADTGGLSDVLGLERARGGKGARHDPQRGGAATGRAA